MGSSPFQLVRHPLRVRRIVVRGRRAVTPHMVRITFGGDDLDGFANLAPEDHVRLYFPETGSRALVLPEVGPSGVVNPPGANPTYRDYTPRRHEVSSKELDFDFYLHGEGVASRWAAGARAGDVLGMAGPRGSFVLTEAVQWHLFVGDETALPEFGRRIESLERECRALAVLVVHDEVEQQTWESAAALSIRWLHRSRLGTRLADVLEAEVGGLVLPEGPGICWVAGEASETRRVLDLLVARGVPRAMIRASGHWKRGVSNHDHHLPLEGSR